MGLLDDAIRDHLELKRRRGADPAEVERAERDALGPVRRQPEGADDLDYVDEFEAEPSAGAGDLLYDDEPGAYQDEPEPPAWGDHAAEPSRRDPSTASPAHEAPPPPAQEPPPAPAPEPPPSRARREDVDEPHLGVETKPHEAVSSEHADPGAPSASGDAAPPSPQPAPAAPRPNRGGGIHEETEEYDVEAEEYAGKEREDVLEETPEFLQDTPDHDRLWFEQRPPRDFNFDG
jgi:hypothetical protein